jgi:small GTP-binding protein
VFKANGSNFPKTYNMTLGCEVGARAIPVPKYEKTNVELVIFDISGDELFSKMWPDLLGDVSQIALVFDITSSSSFKNLAKWKDLAAKYAVEGFTGVIVGTKGDLAKRRQVSESDARTFAKQCRMEYFETSAVSLSRVERTDFGCR